ncbi:MAG: TonB-dependent receptor [Acidobacteria bacterium]|nr:TonB-dependent receptor [Acidobacteriota bacterium]
MGQLFLFAILGFWIGHPCAAQNSYGRVTGRVVDSTGAVVSGASVRMTQTETGITAATATNAEGLFDIPNLLPGPYRLQAEIEGFKRHDRSGLEVRVGDLLSLNVSLELGSVSETVTVNAEAPLLETTSASMGQVVDNRTLTEMPLSGRGFSYLMQLSPTVIATNAPMHGWLPQARGSVSSISVAGTRVQNSEFTLDGIPNMEQQGVIAFQPPPEMIQEFRVQTAAYDASMGRFTGANINMVLKNGTNEYHGSLWFSHLSRPLMTHPFFVNRSLYDLSTGPPTRQKRDSLWPATKTNRYRVQLGGPIRIPKLYDGRNRTFFSYGNDYMLRIFAGGGFQTVPTVEQRRGDFSGLLRLGPQYQIYDPATIAAAANGRFSRQPLAGNLIPASRIDRAAQDITALYPLPNASASADGRNNFQGVPASLIDYQSHMIRVDQVVSANHRFYVSFSYSKIFGDQGRNLVNDALGSITDSGYRGLALDDVLTLRPDLVLNFRYGLTRFRNITTAPTTGMDLAALGLAPSLVNQLDRSLVSLPTVNIDGLTAIGANLPSKSATNYHYVSGTATNSRGAHTLRFGGEFRILGENAYDYGNVSPSYTFGSLWTRGPLDNSPAAPIGQGFASFLFGLPTDGFIDRNDSYAERSGYLGLFVHDDWKVTRKLTVNWGVRYEYELPTNERFNRTNRGFDFRTPNPANAAARANYARAPIPQVPLDEFQLRGGLLFAGVNGAPRGLWNPDRNNFSPRVGVAYSPSPSTVIRAGYGTFFESLGADRLDVGQQGFNQRTRLNASDDNGLTFRATLANPFPTGLLNAQGAAAGLATYLGLAPSFVTTSRRTGYMQRWSVNLQRQLGSRLIVEAGYTGNRGTKLGVPVEYNALPAGYLSRSPERDQALINFNTQAVTSPFRGIPEFANSPAFFNNQNMARTQLLRPYPHFSAVSSTINDGFSWYHAGHIRMEKRFSGGFNMTASYTWSKFMEAVERLNSQDLDPHHVISPQDRPHHIAVSGIYEIPFGQGRRWLSAGGWKAHVVGGWSINAIYQWQSGPPIGFGNVLFRGSLAGLVIPYADRSPSRWFNIAAGFERDPARQLDQNYRTFPLRLTGLRADGWNNWDLSLFKDFRFTERIRLQLRAEAVDAFNHAMFAAPTTGPVNTLFGTVNATIWTEQKKVTVGAKLAF